MADLHPHDDRLIDLAHGLCHTSHRKNLLKHLHSCAACEERFRKIVAEHERLAAEGLPPFLAKGRQKSAWFSKKGVRWGAAAAAVVLVFLLLAPLTSLRKTTVTGHYWMPIDAEETLLRVGTTEVDREVFLKALAAYRSHSADEVVALLAGKTIPPEFDSLKLLMASALLNSGKPHQASEILLGLNLDTMPLPWRDRGKLILAEAFIREGKKEEARLLYESLKNSTDPTVRDRVLPH